MVKLLSMLTSIKINLSLKSNDSLSQVYDIMNQILQDVIATCCLRLSCISINGTETISNWFCASSKKTTGGKLISSSGASTLEEDKRMTHGIIQGLEVPQQLVDILNNSLGNSLRSITFQNCTFSRDEFNNAVMDLTGLKNLEHFKLDISGLHFKAYLFSLSWNILQQQMVILVMMKRQE